MSAWNFVLKSAELFQGKNNAVNWNCAVIDLILPKSSPKDIHLLKYRQGPPAEQGGWRIRVRDKRDEI